MKEKLADAIRILECVNLESVPYCRIDGKYFPSDEQKMLYSIAEGIVGKVLEELVAIQEKPIEEGGE